MAPFIVEDRCYIRLTMGTDFNIYITYLSLQLTVD